jgi:hypothetical protein
MDGQSIQIETGACPELVEGKLNCAGGNCLVFDRGLIDKFVSQL